MQVMPGTVVNGEIVVEGTALPKGAVVALAPHGNPNTDNLFAIVNALQKKTKVRLRVMAG